MIVLTDWVKRLDQLYESAEELPSSPLKNVILNSLARAVVGAHSLVKECGDATQKGKL